MIQRMKTLPQRMKEDFSYKSVALAVALVLWVTMLGRKDITVARRLPIQFLNEAHYEVKGPRQTEVEVEVAGPRMALKKFSQTDQMFTLDLSNLKAGTHKVRLTRDGFSVPVGVKVVAIRPDEITVTLENLQEKSP